jgi:hypothetical protein
MITFVTANVFCAREKCTREYFHFRGGGRGGFATIDIKG